MKLTFYKAYRRGIRTSIKRYLIIFKEDIEKDFNIALPSEKEIEQMPKSQFEELINYLTPIVSPRKELDMELDEMLDLYHILNRKIKVIEDSRNLNL